MRGSIISILMGSEYACCLRCEEVGEVVVVGILVG